MILDTIFRFPGKAAKFTSSLLFGGFLTEPKPFNPHSENLLDDSFLDSQKAKSNKFEGIFPFILNRLNAGMNQLARLVNKHQRAISIAFWASLAAAIAITALVVLWPVALAAIVNFTILGVSIASVVGTGFFAQVGAVAGLTALATSVAVYTAASITNFVKGAKKFFTGSSLSTDQSLLNEEEESSSEDLGIGVTQTNVNIPPRSDFKPDENSKPEIISTTKGHGLYINATMVPPVTSNPEVPTGTSPSNS
ncbi:MAG: hypothetical protein Q8M40_07760 [Legionella sp.]|nr:hypothetical protein [Legionella sp.]